MSAQNARLEATLLEGPGDVRAWSIYGDWLEAEGDPRGEWVGLMLARESAPTKALVKAERAFFEANKGWLLGPELTKAAASLCWRRGFLTSAAVDTTDGLRELLTHPSARFLEHATLAPRDDDAEEWSKLIDGAPWRSVHSRHLANFAAVLALPQLKQGVLEIPYNRTPKLEWSKAHALEKVTISRASSEVLEQLLGDLPPMLKELRLTDFQDVALEALTRHPNASKLALVSVDGQTTDDGLEQLRRANRPGKLVVAFSPEDIVQPPDLPGVVSFVRDERLETAFVVLDSPQLGSQERATLVRLAQACRCQQLVAFVAQVRLAGRPVTVCRFHSDDTTASLFPVVIANELSKLEKLRTAVFTLSESNDLARGLSFGGPAFEAAVGKRLRPRTEMAAAHKVEGSNYDRPNVVREVLDQMLGLDPGPDAIETLLRALDESVGFALHGERFSLSKLPPLLTQEPPVPESEEDEDEDHEDDSGEYEEEDFEEFVGANEVATPVEEEPVREEPSMIDQPLVAQVTAQASDAEEEEVEELDEDAEPDASDADAGEIWNEGPVEPEADWVLEPVDDPFLAQGEPPDPDKLSAEQLEASLLTYCTRCATPADTAVCASCLDELCEGCLPVEQGGELICAQCVSAPSRPRPRLREHS